MLGPSWKTSLAGLLVLVTPGLVWLLTTYAHMDATTANGVAVWVIGIISGIGLLQAKDKNVTNAPAPLPEAVPVPPSK